MQSLTHHCPRDHLVAFCLLGNIEARERCNPPSLAVVIERALLEQSAVFRVLNDLRGRFLRVLARQQLLSSPPVPLETPHQLEIGP